MLALASIKPFNVVKDIGPGLCSGDIPTPVQVAPASHVPSCPKVRILAHRIFPLGQGLYSLEGLVNPRSLSLNLDGERFPVGGGEEMLNQWVERKMR